MLPSVSHNASYHLLYILYIELFLPVALREFPPRHSFLYYLVPLSMGSSHYLLGQLLDASDESLVMFQHELANRSQLLEPSVPMGSNNRSRSVTPPLTKQHFDDSDTCPSLMPSPYDEVRSDNQYSGEGKGKPSADPALAGYVGNPNEVLGKKWISVIPSRKSIVKNCYPSFL